MSSIFSVWANSNRNPDETGRFEIKFWSDKFSDLDIIFLPCYGCENCESERNHEVALEILCESCKTYSWVSVKIPKGYHLRHSFIEEKLETCQNCPIYNSESDSDVE